MRTQTDKTELFERMPIPRAVMSLSIPMVLSSLVMLVYNLADTFFVAKMNDPLETAAVTLASPVLLAFNAVNNLFGVGASSRMSRSLGEKDHETVRASAAFGVWGAIIFAMLFSVIATVFRPGMLQLLGAKAENSAQTAAYLKWTVSVGAVPAILNVVMAYLVRAEGASVHASIGTMSGCLLNIILDPIFILPGGLNMGAAGAGLATCLANSVACGYFLVLIAVRRSRTYVSVSPKTALSVSRSAAKEIFGVGIPASIQNLLNVVGMTILNNAVAEYGSEAVSAVGIAQKITMVAMYVAMGFGQGVMPLAGYNYASGNRQRMKEGVLFAAKVSTGILLVLTVFYWIFAEDIVALFMDSGSIVRYGTVFVRGLSLAQPFLALDFLAVGVFQSCGFGLRSLVFAICRKIVLEIPAMLILNRIYPLFGLAYARFAAEVILSAAALMCLLRLFKAPLPEKTATEGGADVV